MPVKMGVSGGPATGPLGKADFGTPNNGEHGVPFYTLRRFVRCLTQSREDHRLDNANLLFIWVSQGKRTLAQQP